MRATVLAIALAVAGCNKGGGSDDQPLPKRELEATHATVVDAEFDIKLPKGAQRVMKSGGAGGDTPQPVKGQGEIEWNLSGGGDTVMILVQLASPTAMQNAMNFEDAAGRRVSRSEETPDGWVVTSYRPDGGSIQARRMIKKDQKALFCNASAIWAKAAHDAARTAWVESICQSLAATKL